MANPADTGGVVACAHQEKHANQQRRNQVQASGARIFANRR
jgi:hypothetical protein